MYAYAYIHLCTHARTHTHTHTHTPHADLLHQMFNMVYDVEVVGEKAFVKWREEDRERMGKGNAVNSVKPFFDWLESAEVESDGGGDV